MEFLVGRNSVPCRAADRPRHAGHASDRGSRVVNGKVWKTAIDSDAKAAKTVRPRRAKLGQFLF